MSDKCPVCRSDIPDRPRGFGSSLSGVHGAAYSCPRCGGYQVESFASAQLPTRLDSEQKVAVLSHWIRSRHEAIAAGGLGSKEPVILTDELVSSILKQSPPTPAEQADRFVLWLGDSRHPRGKLLSIRPDMHQSIMGSTTPEEFQLVLYYLLDTGLLIGNKSGERGAVGRANVALSFEGWQRYEQLRRGNTDSRKAFMAMPYGEKELDQIVENVFKPAVKPTGFDLSRLDDPGQPAGLIDDELRVAIRTSRFLIADLTHENRGAYWEAGYAEGLGRPVIYTCEEKKFEELQTHFDTNHHLTIKWNTGDPHKLEDAAKKLKDTIRATLPAEAKLIDE